VSSGDSISWYVAVFSNADTHRIQMKSASGIKHGFVGIANMPASMDPIIFDFVAEHQCWLSQQIILEKGGLV